LYFLRDILVPLVIAFFLAVLADALVKTIRRRWSGAPSWFVATLAGLLAISATVAGIAILARGAALMIREEPEMAKRVDGLVRGVGQSLHLSEPLGLRSIVGRMDTAAIAHFLMSGIPVVGSVLLIIIYFGFMLSGHRRIARKFYAMAKLPGGGGSPNVILGRIAADIRTYLWVQTIAASLVTVASAAAMTAIGVHNVLFWAVILFLLHFIPEIGTTIGSIAVALFALVQFPTTWQAVAVFGIIQLAAFLVGNFIYPRLQADAQNIDPITTLFALSFWTLLWGIQGAFLAAPLTVILMKVFAHFDSTRWLAALLSNDGKPDSGPTA